MRLPKLTYDELTPRQREAYERHFEKRKRVSGPYGVWLHSPDLMDRVSPLSNYMRWDAALPEKLREFGILVTARFWDAQYSWNAHVEKARAAGIADAVIDDLAANRTPAFTSDEERVYYNFAMEILKNHFVSAATFAEAKAIFGERGVVDLIGAIGYFSMLQICLNSAEVDLQPDRAPPFGDMRGYQKTG